MEELVYAGTNLSYSIAASPQISTKKRQAPQPPKTAGPALPPPPVRALQLPQRQGPNPPPSAVGELKTTDNSSQWYVSGTCYESSNRGHTLDLLISRGLNISSIVIKDVALSDHICIFFDILIYFTKSRSVSVRKRCINENTSVLFMKAIFLTPSISADSVDLLLDSFNSKVKNVISPIKVSKKTGRQKSSWRKSTAVQSMKRQCRKAEWMWRKTLEIHYSIYKDSLHAFNVEQATARQTFSNLINSHLNNTRTLFATVERLTDSTH